MRARSWYNGDRAENLYGYINDKTTRLIGWPMMRQIRVKSTACADRRIIARCFDDATFFSEEKISYEPGWMKETNESYSSSIRRAFQCQSSQLLDTYGYRGNHGSYSGNGYVYELRGPMKHIRTNISSLHQLGWLDARTRAILLQLTLYNPNVQLLTSVNLVAEMLPSTGIYLTTRIEPIQFYSNSSRC